MILLDEVGAHPTRDAAGKPARYFMPIARWLMKYLAGDILDHCIRRDPTFASDFAVRFSNLALRIAHPKTALEDLVRSRR